MTKNNLIWLAILSLIATFFIWLFNGSLFSVCYSVHPAFANFHFLSRATLPNCLLYSFIIAMGALFLAPVLATLLFNTLYILIFNRRMPFSHSFIWFSWLIALVYISVQLTFLPAY